ncbi:hypothetical protein ACN4EE_13965 [Geminocystis sp. CENA526]
MIPIINKEIYGSLLAETLPKVIETEVEYEQLLAVVNGKEVLVSHKRKH